MKKLVVGAGMIAGSLVVVSLLPSLAGAAVGKFQEVIVRNSDAEPVPTKAIGTSQVEVTNLPAAAAAPERYSTQVAFTAPDSATETCGNDPVLPEGKRMVVESVVATVTRGTTRPELHLYGVGAPQYFDLTLVHPEEHPGDLAIWGATIDAPFTIGTLRGGGVFDDPGSAYISEIGMTGAPCVLTLGELRGVQVQYHGYLEDAPQP